MIDLLNKDDCPSLEEIGTYIKNPVFTQFCSELKDRYQCNEKIAYSSCSWEPGWHIKWKKAGKTLCTLYPRARYFTVMIVVGEKEKEGAETILPTCTPELQSIYRQTREGNGQKWLMIDIAENDDIYRDAFRLIQIRMVKSLSLS